MAVDLHIHSTASDGSYTPEQIIEIAVGKGLRAIAICDHDSVGGVQTALDAAAGRITLIPGLEISTHHGHQELHILGYCLRLDHQPLLDELAHVRRERVARIERTLQRLGELGVQLTMEQVWEAGSLEPGHDAALGRPHVAAALVHAGIVASPGEAFDRYLRRGRPAFVDRYRLLPEQAIALIRQAGGLPVLGHPALARLDQLVEQLALQGLGGVEAYHTAHTEMDTKRYLKLAERLNLIVTGGTDSHGPKGSYPVEIGAVPVPDECAERLLAWAERRSP